MDGRRRRAWGFTLIELMIVVTILGVLAAVAIPAFQRAIRRSKSSEATVNLRRIFDGAVTSYQHDEVTRAGDSLAARFPASVAATPGVDHCCDNSPSGRCPADSAAFTANTWQALHFSVDDPHYYWYAFVSDGEGMSAAFTARAQGNLDCDDTHSTFERLGYVDLMGGVTGGAGVYRNKPLE